MDFQAFPPDTNAPHLDMEKESVQFTCDDITRALSQSPLYNTELKSVQDWKSNIKPVPNTSARRNTNSVAEGEKCENSFKEIALKHGYEIVPTSEGDDFYDRIDFALKINNSFILIDVKAARRVSRSDTRPQQKYTWLELHKSGSLFSGKSTHFAFEVNSGFVIVDKEAVRKYILRNFNSSQCRVESSTQALMKPYRRKGRFYEWISLIKVEDLIMVGGILYLL